MLLLEGVDTICEISKICKNFIEGTKKTNYGKIVQIKDMKVKFNLAYVLNLKKEFVTVMSPMILIDRICSK